MSNNLKDIVNVQIQIQTPATDSSGFGTMLILGVPPLDAKDNAPPDVGLYTSLEAVKSAGWLPANSSGEADPVYTAANVGFGQSPQPSKIYIAVCKKKPGETEEYEPVADTLDRALGKTGWYAIAPAGIAESEYDDIAAWTEANERLFGFTQNSIDSPLELSTYLRTFAIYGKVGESDALETPSSNQYVHVAWLARCLEFEPGSETWALKTMSMIEPAELTATQMNALQDTSVSYFAAYAGKNVTQGGKTVGGEWIDVIRFRDWLQNDMQLRLFNLLLTHPKIPYTNSGITLVQNQMIASLKQGQKQGGITEDEYDAQDNLIPGWTVTVPNSADLSSSDKASRILKGCKFHAKLAGAVHAIEVKGTLTYEEGVS